MSTKEQIKNVSETYQELTNQFPDITDVAIFAKLLKILPTPLVIEWMQDTHYNNHANSIENN